ncbi:phosphonate ABC transporter ATP-binding protein [Variovorax saccharolyticus]|uniref:phosphonate ABC transporter ATP-binding protein n=1 Tax=Variovorax saccharolyticus TaxID=3053516 RepID=UPI002575EA26|nr:phosphonate ABC transporter ATP-binding protein [Variovorax sp. J31P216]MDM0025162.1 phosphonate ABC transporter ATP-binding protein [Variovorax sp. J31P216]
MLSPSMLRFDSVAMRYPDGTAALDGVSLQLPRGQFCVVLGASGAGKSTLLRMANGLVTPTSGAVHVEDRRLSPAALSAIRPRIGMIHQQFNLVLRASVATNVLSGALPGLPWWRAVAGLFPEPVQRKACMLVAAVGLEEQHLRRRASELSGGQQQRVGIARAFMLDPPLVLADEPVASLDPQASHDVLALLRQQARDRGATVLCSLHQVELARAFADRIVALRHGRVVFDGPAQDFDSRVAHAVYAAGGAPPADGKVSGRSATTQAPEAVLEVA